MNTMLSTWLTLVAALTALLATAPAATAQTDEQLLKALRLDEETAKVAMADLVKRGKEAIPALRGASKDTDPIVRRRVNTVLGRITGQWGSKGTIVWKRSLEEAMGLGKPILLLQLFGNFDEEFC
jgi:hypothetical protein